MDEKLPKFIKVGKASDFTGNKIYDITEAMQNGCQKSGKRVLVRLPGGADQFSSLEGLCSHDQCSLAKKGEYFQQAVPPYLQCTCHGSEFFVESGKVKQGPAGEPLKVFATKLQDGDVEVACDPAIKELS